MDAPEPTKENEMDAPELKGDALVWRITVDEKLTYDLVRVLISPLAEGIGEFYDGKEDWGKEQAFFLRPDNYLEALRIPKPKAQEFPWTDLQEGRVFLSGEFEIVGDPKEPKGFIVSPGSRQFLRVDAGFKQEVKRLYFRALKSRRRS